MPLDLVVPTTVVPTVNPACPSLPGEDRIRLTEIEVHGRWSHRLGVDVSIDIRRRLRQHPTDFIIDLRGLVDPHGASLALWLATRRICSAIRPPVRLVLCLSAATTLDRRLRRVDATRLPRFTTMPAARAVTTHDRKPPKA